MSSSVDPHKRDLFIWFRVFTEIQGKYTVKDVVWVHGLVFVTWTVLVSFILCM